MIRSMHVTEYEKRLHADLYEKYIKSDDNIGGLSEMFGLDVMVGVDCEILIMTDYFIAGHILKYLKLKFDTARACYYFGRDSIALRYVNELNYMNNVFKMIRIAFYSMPKTIIHDKFNPEDEVIKTISNRQLQAIKPNSYGCLRHDVFVIKNNIVLSSNIIVFFTDTTVSDCEIKERINKHKIDVSSIYCTSNRKHIFVDVTDAGGSVVNAIVESMDSITI